MREAVFKTARFKIHNPSRHKQTILWYAMTGYHNTLKRVLEAALAPPDFRERVCTLDKKGKSRPNKFLVSKVLYTIAPKGWALAPLRDYLIGDATAMLMSHLSKDYKGKHESNPPTSGPNHSTRTRSTQSAARDTLAWQIGWNASTAHGHCRGRAVRFCADSMEQCCAPSSSRDQSSGVATCWPGAATTSSCCFDSLRRNITSANARCWLRISSIGARWTRIGTDFSREMARLRQRIADLQRRGKRGTRNILFGVVRVVRC